MRVVGAMRAFPYLVCGAVCLLIGAILGAYGVRLTSHTAIDWSATATVIKDIATALGIAGAGAWAAFLAARRRSLNDRAQLIHRYRRWGKNEGQEVLRVYVELRNIGDVQITPGPAWTWVQTPPKGKLSTSVPTEDSWLDAARIDHPMQVDEVFLEPGETEDYNFDFPIPHGSKYLQVYTYVECQRRPGAESDSEEPAEAEYDHWDLTTLIDLEQKSASDETSSTTRP